MPYPPPDHYLSDLGVRPRFETDSSAIDLEIAPALCGPGGGALLGVLATAIDMAAGGLSRRHAEPDWVATSDLAIDLMAPVPPGRCAIDCRLVRRGRSLVTMAVEIRSSPAAAPGSGSLAGVATAAFAVLPNPGREQGGGVRGDGRRAERPEDAEPVAAASPAGHEAAPSSARSELPLHRRLGIRVVDRTAGAIEAPLDDYVRNTFGALQGGVVAVLCEAAMGAATGRPLASLAVRYLSLGRVGPFRATGERVAAGSGAAPAAGPGGVARAVLRDRGAGDALLALATGRLAP